MFNSDGMHVLDVQRGHRKLVITVESDAEVTGCPVCGVVPVGHGRRRVRAADAPCLGVPVLIVWSKRVWRCAEPDCAQLTWTETHELIAPRARLTSRAIGWAVDALAHDDTTVSALALSGDDLICRGGYDLICRGRRGVIMAWGHLR